MIIINITNIYKYLQRIYPEISNFIKNISHNSHTIIQYQCHYSQRLAINDRTIFLEEQSL